MIYDTLSNSRYYAAALGERFALGLAYLERFDSSTSDGRVTLDGDDVFALVQSYIATPAGNRPFEAHRTYADIQFIAAGDEIIQYSPLGRLSETTPYSAATDVAWYSGDNDFPLYMRQGSFAILLPHDGHKPGCSWQTQERVKKVVVKIRL